MQCMLYSLRDRNTDRTGNQLFNIRARMFSNCFDLKITRTSRLTIVSREAKKSQRPLSELFTGNTAKKLANALAKLP